MVAAQWYRCFVLLLRRSLEALSDWPPLLVLPWERGLLGRSLTGRSPSRLLLLLRKALKLPPTQLRKASSRAVPPLHAPSLRLVFVVFDVWRQPGLEKAPADGKRRVGLFGILQTAQVRSDCRRRPTWGSPRSPTAPPAANAPAPLSPSCGREVASRERVTGAWHPPQPAASPLNSRGCCPHPDRSRAAVLRLADFRTR